jgi:probable HAF family extracellular repeat protein
MSFPVTRTSVCTRLALLVTLGAMGGPVYAAPSYSFTVMGESSSTAMPLLESYGFRPASSEAKLNNAGQVIGVDRAGRGYISDGTNRTMFAAPIGTTGAASFTQLAALNDSGQVAGTYTVDGVRSAFLFDGNRIVDIGARARDTLGMRESYAYGMNERGQVVGGIQREVPGFPYGFFEFGERAFVFGADTLVNLGQLAAEGVVPQVQGSYATRINNNGQVLGVSKDLVNGNNVPVLWNGAAITNLTQSPPLGARIGQAVAINDQGWAVGSIFSNPVSRAFLVTDSQALNLLFPWDDIAAGSYGALAVDVNNRGQVIGTALTDLVAGYGPTLFNRAFVWENGVMRDLAGGSTDPSFTNTAAFDINERGEVVGVGLSTAFGVATSDAFVWRSGLMQSLNDLVVLPAGARFLSADSINERGQIAGR